MFQSFDISYLTNCEFIICYHSTSFDFSSCIIPIFHSSTIFQSTILSHFVISFHLYDENNHYQCTIWNRIARHRSPTKLKRFRNPGHIGPWWELWFRRKSRKNLYFINPKWFSNQIITHPFFNFENLSFFITEIYFNKRKFSIRIRFLCCAIFPRKISSSSFIFALYATILASCSFISFFRIYFVFVDDLDLLFEELVN